MKTLEAILCLIWNHSFSLHQSSWISNRKKLHKIRNISIQYVNICVLLPNVVSFRDSISLKMNLLQGKTLNAYAKISMSKYDICFHITSRSLPTVLLLVIWSGSTVILSMNVVISWYMLPLELYSLSLSIQYLCSFLFSVVHNWCCCIMYVIWIHIGPSGSDHNSILTFIILLWCKYRLFPI
jgi:hypothetical protein